MTYDAFISHSNEEPDRGLSLRLSGELRAKGIKTFLDVTDLPGAVPATDQLAAAIRAARMLVVLISDASANSTNVRWEVEVARELKKSIAPTWLREYKLPMENRIFTTVFELTPIHMYPDWDSGRNYLLRALGQPVFSAGATAEYTPPPDDKEPSGGASPKPPPVADDDLPSSVVTSTPQRDDGGLQLAELRYRVSRQEPIAMYLMGRLLLDGDGSKDTEAIRLISRAASGPQGLVEALHTLGDCYRKQRGVGRDFRRMLKLYQAAADRGYAPSYNNLGRAYEFGWGVKPDYGRAYRRYHSAAELGFAPAQYAVARMSLGGHGILINDANALSFAHMAARQFYGPALFLIGRLHRKGRGVAQSDVEACKWYRRAADQGDIEGMRHLGSMYQRGLGVEADPERAKAWFAQADVALKRALR